MNQAVWGILYSPVYHLITVWTMSKMVPLRRPVRFYLLWMLAAVPVYCIPGESAYGWIRSPLTSVMWLTFVLLGAKKASLRAAVGAILISLLSVISEVVASLITLLLYGKNMGTEFIQSSPAAAFWVQVIFWGVLSLLCLLLLRAWNRNVRVQEEDHLWRFALVPATQYLLVAFSGVFALMNHAPLRRYLPLGGLVLCCALADVLLFRALRRYTQEQLAQKRSAILEEQLSQQLEYYRAVVARIEQTALLRHDLRNQLQTVQTLVDRGEEARAREILTEYSALLRAQDEEAQA